MNDKDIINLVNEACSEHGDYDVPVHKCLELYCEENNLDIDYEKIYDRYIEIETRRIL